MFKKKNIEQEEDLLRKKFKTFLDEIVALKNELKRQRNAYEKLLQKLNKKKRRDLELRRATRTHHACGRCGTVFQVIPSEMRYRLAGSKSGKIYCSMACSAKDVGDRLRR